jgi:hypothetical protein
LFESTAPLLNKHTKSFDRKSANQVDNTEIIEGEKMEISQENDFK